MQESPDQSRLAVVDMTIITAIRTRDLLVSARIASHITVSTQALEDILSLMIHGPTGTLRRCAIFEFGDDFFDIRRCRAGQERNIPLTERTVTESVACEVQRTIGKLSRCVYRQMSIPCQ